MLLLDLFIWIKLIEVEKLKETMNISMFYRQVISTFLSVITTIAKLIVEKHGMKEKFLSYIMKSIKAKQDWVPYGEEFRNRGLDRDIDFSNLEFKIPYFTDITGLYMRLDY